MLVRFIHLPYVEGNEIGWRRSRSGRAFGSLVNQPNQISKMSLGGLKETLMKTFVQPKTKSPDIFWWVRFGLDKNLNLKPVQIFFTPVNKLVPVMIYLNTT